MFNNKQNMAGNNNNIHQKIDEDSYTKKFDALKTFDIWKLFVGPFEIVNIVGSVLDFVVECVSLNP
jgi:hypothetical protein